MNAIKSAVFSEVNLIGPEIPTKPSIINSKIFFNEGYPMMSLPVLIFKSNKLDMKSTTIAIPNPISGRNFVVGSDLA